MNALVKSAHNRIPRPAGAIQKLAMLNSTGKANLSTSSFVSINTVSLYPLLLSERTACDASYRVPGRNLG